MKISDKLEHFATDIMADVNRKRQSILEKVDREYEEAYNKKETEFLTQAYEIIQDGLKKIDKEKNEMISKTMMDNKVKLLGKRNQVIQNVIDLTRLKLVKFCKSDEYKDYLLELIKESIEKVGEGDIDVTLNYSDAALKDEVEKACNCNVIIAGEKVDFIGGCQVLNKTRQIYIDDTFAIRLEKSQEDFIKSCKIDVEL